MRVLVTGGRKYANTLVLNTALTKVHKLVPITCLLEGGATGADTLAKCWAINNGVLNETRFACWHMHGNAAGILRNLEMLDTKPDLVVSFAGGRGTAHCTREAQLRGMKVLLPDEAVMCGWLDTDVLDELIATALGVK